MTAIEWTDKSWNPLAAFDKETGKRGWMCSKVSPGCTNCYAERMNKRFGTGHGYTVPELDEVEFRLVNLEKPAEWARSDHRFRIFVNSMTDLFHERVTDEMLDKMFAAMASAPQHVYQILTKRPGRMRHYVLHRREHLGPINRHASVKIPRGDWPGPNVWLGTSIEDQQRAEERLGDLLLTPAEVRFVSCEPLLDSLELRQVSDEREDRPGSALLFPLAGEVTFEGRNEPMNLEHGSLDWVIVGGESGPGARPCELNDVRSLIEQCVQCGVPIFVKQLGSNPQIDGEGIHQEDSKGGDPGEWPVGVHVRQIPSVGGIP